MIVSSRVTITEQDALFPTDPKAQQPQAGVMPHGPNAGRALGRPAVAAAYGAYGQQQVMVSQAAMGSRDGQQGGQVPGSE